MLVPGMSEAPVRESSVPVGGEFAVTATLPSLADVISFKENTASFDAGYYRFVPHPRVKRLAEELARLFRVLHCRLVESPEIALLELLLCLHAPGHQVRLCEVRAGQAAPSLLDPSFFPACERRDFLFCRDPGELGRNDTLLLSAGTLSDVGPSHGKLTRRAADNGASVIVFVSRLPDGSQDIPAARFWVSGLPPGIRGGAVLGASDRIMSRLGERVKRRGPLLSSREAAAVAGVSAAGADARVCETLARMEGGTSAFLYASGMSAITRALDLVRRPGRSQLIAVGHLFSDTFDSLRLAPLWPGDEPNIFLGVDELDRLPGVMTDQTAAVLTETVTNPLNDVPDLAVIARAAGERKVALIVDNTIATPLLCRPLTRGADIVVHSTTKFLNGRNNHGGGALVVRRPEHAEALSRMRSRWNDGMSLLEAAELEKNVATLPQRMERFVANARRVGSFLAGHPAVGRLSWSGHPSHRSYATARRQLEGPSSVITFTLVRDCREGLQAFYDPPLPNIVKAPSLGSDWTLVCPYALLAHYHDTDELLRSIGLSRWLVRLSVGCEENIQPVIDSLDAALARV